MCTYMHTYIMHMYEHECICIGIRTMNIHMCRFVTYAHMHVCVYIPNTDRGPKIHERYRFIGTMNLQYGVIWPPVECCW